jgi:rubredoxin
MGEVIQLNDYRPHDVGRCTCRECGHKHISVHPVTTDPQRLECPRCGAQNADFESYLS